jgi:hypothetical protein
MRTFYAENSFSTAIKKLSRPPSGKQIQHTVYPLQQTVGHVHPVPLCEAVTKLRDHFFPAFWPLLWSLPARATAQQSVVLCGTCRQETRYAYTYEPWFNCIACGSYRGEVRIRTSPALNGYACIWRFVRLRITIIHIYM